MKKSYYSGGAGVRDYVLVNYLEGKYLNPKTGIKENLQIKTNKYNLEAIKELNTLNQQFFSIILFDSITQKIIEMSSEHSYGDSINIYRLMHAQSKTIKFNKIFKGALKKYEINKRKILDMVTREIDSEKERANRNITLVREMWQEYGLSELLEKIEEDRGDIFEQLSEFVNNNPNELHKITDESEEEETHYFDKLSSEYIEYIKSIADKNNISIDNQISETLRKHREYRRNLREQMQQEKDERKQQAKEAKAYKSILDDNNKIQHDMNCIEGDIKHKIGIRDRGIPLFKRVEQLGGTAYYITMCIVSKPTYSLSLENTTVDVRKMELFPDEESALKRLEELNQYASPEIKSMYKKVTRLTTRNYNHIKKSVTFSKSKGVEFKVSLMKMLLNDAGADDFSSKALEIIYGPNTSKREGRVVVYTLMNNYNPDLAYFIGTDGKNFFITENNIETFMQSVEQSKNFDINKIKINNLSDFMVRDYSIHKHIIQFRNRYADWLDKIRLEEQRRREYENQLINCAIKDTVNLNKDELKLHEKALNRYPSRAIYNLKSRVDKIREEGYTDLYIIQYGKSDYRNFYYREGYKASESLGQTDLFTSYEDAQRIVETKLVDKNARIYKIEYDGK